MQKLGIAIGLCLAMALMLGGCPPSSTDNQTSASGAKQAAIIKVPLNSKGNTCEQQNILDRTKVTTDPTKVMWIHLVALDGKIIRRMPVRNKVTSSGKRLEPTSAAVYGTMDHKGDLPSYDGYYTEERIQPDGTYGGSDNYIYWFDPMGRYHQYGTAGGIGYLVTDYPIDLENPIDAVTGLYNANKAASEWQEKEEAKLKAKEGK